MIILSMAGNVLFFFTLRNVRTMNVPSLSVWWKNRRRESTTLTQHYNDDAHCHPTNKNLLNENCCSTSASYCSYLSRPKVSQRNLSNASNGQTGKLLTTAEMCVCVCALCSIWVHFRKWGEKTWQVFSLPILQMTNA